MSWASWMQGLKAHWAIGLFVCGLGLAGTLTAGGLEQLLRDQRISTVLVHGQLKYLDARTLEEALTQEFGGTFFETSLRGVISDVKQHPWIADAAVRRVWPDTLVVEVTEQRPVAILNDTLYLGISGDLFDPPIPVNEPLPRLYGSEALSQQMYSHYGVFSERLSGLVDVVSVTHGTDLGWVVELSGGTEIRLGRSDLLSRLARARDVIESPAVESLDRIAQIDARYDNGVALTPRAIQ